MIAGYREFTIEQGTTFSRIITWKDDDAALVDLTGYTARMHIRVTQAASTTILELTTENGRIALGGAAGTVTLTITATDTAALTFTNGVYDLELISGSTITRLLEGPITLSKEVTR